MFYCQRIITMNQLFVTPFRSIKMLFFVAFFALANNSYGQYFNISPVVIDTVSQNEFNYKVEGIADFSDSLTVHAQVISVGENQQLLFEGSISMLDTASSTLTAFVYDPIEKIFEFELGTFSDPNLFVRVWVTQLGSDEIENEVYYKQ